MSWKVWGKFYEVNELSDTSVFEDVLINQKTVLLGARVWVILIGAVTFSNLRMKIFDDGILLAESLNSYSHSDIKSLDSAVREIYFDFDKVDLKDNFPYRFVMNADGYSPFLETGFAWRIDFPNPVYVPLVTNNSKNIAKFPLSLTLVGSEE